MSAHNSFGSLGGDRPVLLPPGDYELSYVHHETKSIFRRHKLFVRFKVVTFGEHFEKEVCRYYGVRRLIGKAGKHGRFEVGWKSDFLREYARMFGAPARLDRIAMTPFAKAIFVGRVRTVEQGHDQQEIPSPLRYSVVDKLLRNTAIVDRRPCIASVAPSAPAPPT